ncbi:MAG TPA: twin-arginine translocase subunit TatC [Solirubrobacteraceae bacterium]|jgi:sec-independent protein translocase protein TatC|nr:twin-arginine translocase subunit TatC [Solirubrobacteraceae bacterium]
MAIASTIRPIGHEDRLSLVEHLEELRARLIISVAALLISFSVCLWQNHRVLRLINRPLSVQTEKQIEKGNGPLGATDKVQVATRDLGVQVTKIVNDLEAPNSGLSVGAQAALEATLRPIASDLHALARPPTDKPVTLGIGEPFTTTLAVAGIFALILALPVILFQLYGFVLPAFSPRERRIALPLMTAIPVLFIAGVAFGYFVVLPAAVHFFQNFNSGQFNVLVQANQYYRFAATILLAMGLIFQVPVGILALTRAGIVAPKTLRKGRPYAVVMCAFVAAFLPGDFITLILETVPLYVLYEASILIADLLDRRDAWRSRRAERS